MVWGAFNPRAGTRRSKSVGAGDWASQQQDSGPLGDRIASGDSCSTPLGWHSSETQPSERAASFAGNQPWKGAVPAPAFRNDRWVLRLELLTGHGWTVMMPRGGRYCVVVAGV